MNEAIFLNLLLVCLSVYYLHSIWLCAQKTLTNESEIGSLYLRCNCMQGGCSNIVIVKTKLSVCDDHPINRWLLNCPLHLSVHILYSLGLNLLHRNLLLAMFPHFIHEHCVKVRDCGGQDDAVGRKGLILHLDGHIAQLALSSDLSHLRQVLHKQIFLLEQDVSFI